MIPVVFDCGILVSAIGWSGNPRHCLHLVARRQVRLCVTAAVWEEYDTRIPQVLSLKRPGVNPRPTLNWLLTAAHFVEPAPLRKQHSRDVKDDRYLACALGGNAKWIVSNDRDLLALEKPFGLEIITPVQLLARVLK
ncbi:MAG: putative toxin-antitoxin system toxin component, PIN family [Limisphaerales bacterium]